MGCKIEGCTSIGQLARNGGRLFMRNLCKKHYERWRKYGDPEFLHYPLDGRTKHPLYRTWVCIKTRCYNKNNKGYRYYGGRGVIMCDAWRDKITGFPTFVKDMGEKPSPEHTVDRIDNDGNYEPGNCRWATKSEQSYNQRPRSSRAFKT